jgi:hypothetical protein
MSTLFRVDMQIVSLHGHAESRRAGMAMPPPMLCLLKRIQDNHESELLVAQELIAMAQNPVLWRGDLPPPSLSFSFPSPPR